MDTIRYAADAHGLAPGVFACIYRPLPDLHLPLVGPCDGDWSLLTWAMVPCDVSLSDYLLVFRSPARLAIPPDISLDSSFGRRQLVLEAADRSMPSDMAMHLADLLLMIAGQQSGEDLPALLAVLAALPAPNLDKRQPVRVAASGRRLHLEGSHLGFYVAVLDGDHPTSTRVTAIRYEGTTQIRTTLDLETAVSGARLWLLGDNRYLALEAEAMRDA